MRAVVVAGRKPLFEMGAADLVVRGLDELSFINLKQLFSNEEGVEGNVSPLICLLARFAGQNGWLWKVTAKVPCGNFGSRGFTMLWNPPCTIRTHLLLQQDVSRQ